MKKRILVPLLLILLFSGCEDVSKEEEDLSKYYSIEEFENLFFYDYGNIIYSFDNNIDSQDEEDYETIIYSNAIFTISPTYCKLQIDEHCYFEVGTVSSHYVTTFKYEIYGYQLGFAYSQYKSFKVVK